MISEPFWQRCPHSFFTFGFVHTYLFLIGEAYYGWKGEKGWHGWAALHTFFQNGTWGSSTWAELMERGCLPQSTCGSSNPCTRSSSILLCSSSARLDFLWLVWDLRKTEKLHFGLYRSQGRGFDMYLCPQWKWWWRGWWG